MFVQPRLAMDYVSVRTFDQDGRLRVAMANISAARVNPYLGDEIPTTGLDPQRRYLLWRHPDELARAAPTFNNLPLLARHVPVSADDHRPEDVVGCTGSDAAFSYPFLTNSLIVWASSAIRAIQDGSQRQLSCAYRYVPVMTPGRTPQGEAYDGIMTEISANHLALVSEGRAGPDVIVADGFTLNPALRRPFRKAA